MNVLFVNDTSAYHCGSFLTCRVLTSLIKKKCSSLEILRRSTKKK